MNNFTATNQIKLNTASFEWFNSRCKQAIRIRHMWRVSDFLSKVTLNRFYAGNKASVMWW